MEIDGEMYEVAKAESGETYCGDCDLSEKCTRKDVEIIPCSIIGEEEILKRV